MATSKFIMAFIICCVTKQSLSCELLINQSFTSRHGRISAISLDVTHASIYYLSRIPPGWRIDIDNDPSWTTSIRAKAVVGAAFMSPADFTGLINLQPETGFSCHAPEINNKLKIKFDFYKNDMINSKTFRYPIIKLGD